MVRHAALVPSVQARVGDLGSPTLAPGDAYEPNRRFEALLPHRLNPQEIERIRSLLRVAMVFAHLYDAECSLS